MNNTADITNSTNLNFADIIPVTNLEIALMCTLFPFLTFLYFLVLCVLLCKKDATFRNSYYTLAVGLGLNDMAMLLCIVYQFSLDLIGYEYMGIGVDTFAGYILQFTFGLYSTQLYIFAIAINRFMAVTFSNLYRKFATVKSSLFTMVAIMVIAFCITTPTLVACGFEYVPFFKFHLMRYYYSDPKCYQYDVSVFEPMDKYVAFTIAGSAFCMYSISAAYSIHKRNTFTNSSLRVSYIREMKLLAQGILLTLTLITLNVVHWMEPPALLNRTVTYLYCGLNPVIYLALDRNLRAKVVQLVLSSKQKVLETSFGMKIITRTTTTTTITPIG